MRTLILASVFFLTGILLTGPRALQADEPAANDRVAALAGRRAEVQALIVELGKQLDALEKSMDAEERGEVDRRRARPSKKAKGKKTDEAEGKKAAEGTAPDAETRDAEVLAPEATDGEDPAEEKAEDEAMDPAQAAILEVAGTYEVDGEAFLQGMEDMLREQMAGEDIPAEFLDSLIEQMRTGLQDFDVTFDLDEDLTWTSTSKVGGEEQTASGTWERDGDKVTLVQTHENGEESEETMTIVGTYDKEEDVLTLQGSEDDGMQIPFALILHRVRDDE